MGDGQATPVEMSLPTVERRTMIGIFDEKGLSVEPKFCLLVVGWPCLSSAVWAAWTQAIGSVLAILAAAWVPARIAKKRKLPRQADTSKVDLRACLTSSPR